MPVFPPIKYEPSLKANIALFEPQEPWTLWAPVIHVVMDCGEQYKLWFPCGIPAYITGQKQQTANPEVVKSTLLLSEDINISTSLWD